jgi:hypothetical protein
LVLLLTTGFPILLGPPLAVKWTVGFSYNVLWTKKPVQLQHWATDVLTRYKDGKLKTKPSKYWVAGKESLKENEIPREINKLWWNKPAIGIATFTRDGIGIDPHDTNSEYFNSFTASSNQVHCVAFSWYLTGVLVGPPDFKTKWNPWYIRQVIPGIYVYCGEK